MYTLYFPTDFPLSLSLSLLFFCLHVNWNKSDEINKNFIFFSFIKNKPIVSNGGSSRGGLGGKCKTMFTQVFVSSPGGSNPAWGMVLAVNNC